MKKMYLMSLIASTLMAGDYGYREFLIDKHVEFIAFDNKTTGYIDYKPSISVVGDYCVIQGGNLTKTIDSEELHAFDKDEIAPLLSMSKDERIAKYGKGDSKIGLSYNREFKKKAIPYSGTMSFDAGGEYECKSTDNQVLFKAYERGTLDDRAIWVVTHKDEPIIDYAKFSVALGHKDSNFLGRSSRKGSSLDIQKKLDADYSTYNSYFDDWNKGLLHKKDVAKYGDKFLLGNAFNFDRKFWLQGSMGELTEAQYFCEAKHGEFMKDGQPFRMFMKDFYENGATPNFDTFKGTYVCVNSSEAFTIKLDEYKVGTGLTFSMSYAVVNKGEKVPENNEKQYLKGQAQINGLLNNDIQKNPMDYPATSITPLDYTLIQNAIKTKAPYAVQQGNNISTSSYNGQDSKGCQLVSIEKEIEGDNGSAKINNYRSCNGQVMTIGETGNAKTQDLSAIVTKVKEKCKTYGVFGMDYQDSVVSCRALDQDRCNLEIKIFQDEKLVDQHIESICGK